MLQDGRVAVAEAAELPQDPERQPKATKEKCLYNEYSNSIRMNSNMRGPCLLVSKGL